MNNRIKELRKCLGLTQAEFGKLIDAKQPYVASLESGNKPITPKIQKAICLECKVNQEWLETGHGKMFVSDPIEDDIMNLYEEIKGKIPRRMLKRVKGFLEKARNFTDEEWQMLESLADKILDE